MNFRLAFLSASLSFTITILIIFATRKHESESRIPMEYLRVGQPKDLLGDLLLGYIRTDMRRLENRGDMYTLGLKLRLLKKIKEFSGSEATELKAEIEKNLFGWLQPTFFDVDSLRDSWEGKGIVIVTGNKHAKLAAHLIKIVRILGCMLPIEIFYADAEDLNQEWITHYDKQFNVKSVSLSSLIESKKLDIHSWDLKPFALLFSSFEEVILFDADAVVLRDPMTLFEEAGYKSEGTVFFKDRIMGGHTRHPLKPWFERSFPDLSDLARNSTMYNEKGHYELEAGLLVMNKAKHYVGILAASLLNLEPIRSKELHEYSHGEKESYWFGLELVGESYYFVPTTAGTIGREHTREDGTKMVCGKLAHFDREGRLLWFNNGILSDSLDPMDLTHIAHEDKYEKLCHVGEYSPIDAPSASILKKILALYDRDPLQSDDPRVGLPMYNLG